MTLSILVCPHCTQALTPEHKGLRCSNNHYFDRARQGYWNLLPVQRKKSKDPGDNPEMVSARRQFLDLDYYKPLADQVIRLVTQQLGDVCNAQILDMGCGEGYYTSLWQEALPKQNFIGLDISKHAIKAATQRNKNIIWLVASGANMPIEKNSLDVLSVVFSRLMPLPMASALKDDGLLILVWPTSRHLIELKQVMYKQLKTSQYDPCVELAPLFSMASKQTLAFEFTITLAAQLFTLLDMTPHGQRINTETKASLLQNLPMQLSFSVNIGCFIKRASI